MGVYYYHTNDKDYPLAYSYYSDPAFKNEGEQMGVYYYHTNDKDYPLAYSHYSDPAFKNEAVIFGKKEDAREWVYADRLRQWDSEKSESSFKAAVKAYGEKSTARRIEHYLRLYFENPNLEIVAVLSGTQPFSEYPWHAYGYKEGS